jgi:hypothetical protein
MGDFSLIRSLLGLAEPLEESEEPGAYERSPRRSEFTHTTGAPETQEALGSMAYQRRQTPEYQADKRQGWRDYRQEYPERYGTPNPLFGTEDAGFNDIDPTLGPQEYTTPGTHWTEPTSAEDREDNAFDQAVWRENWPAELKWRQKQNREAKDRQRLKEFLER